MGTRTHHVAHAPRCKREASLDPRGADLDQSRGYGFWRTMMRDVAFFDVASAAQCVQFSVTFEQEHDVAFLDWSTSLGLLLDGLDDGGDGTFQRDLAKVYGELMRRGVRIEELCQDRPEVYAYEDVSRRILRLVAAVQHTQALEQTARLAFALSSSAARHGAEYPWRASVPERGQRIWNNRKLARSASNDG